MLLVILIFFGLYLGIEIPYLSKNKLWKDLCLGSGILILAIIYGLDFTYQWQVLPNPDIFFKKLQPLTNAIIDLFHLQS